MDTSGGPIHSLFDDDPLHAEAIDAFVLALAGHVDDLQDTEQHGDLVKLAERVAALGLHAAQVGFPPLAQAAEEVATAARERNAELAYKTLLALTDVAQRVRQGHRGSL